MTWLIEANFIFSIYISEVLIYDSFDSLKSWSRFYLMMLSSAKHSEAAHQQQFFCQIFDGGSLGPWLWRDLFFLFRKENPKCCVSLHFPNTADDLNAGFGLFQLVTLMSFLGLTKENCRCVKKKVLLSLNFFTRFKTHCHKTPCRAVIVFFLFLYLISRLVNCLNGTRWVEKRVVRPRINKRWLLEKST